MKSYRIYLASVFLFIALLIFYVLSMKYYIIFHTIVEFAIIIVMFTISTIALTSYQKVKNNSYTFMGIAFIFIGIIELLHTITYKGVNVFQGITANTPTQLWIFARYMESISLLIAPVFYNRKKINLPIYIIIFLLITALGVNSIFITNNFPACYLEESGLTRFKIISEYIIILILLLSMYSFYSLRKVVGYRLLGFIYLSIILSIASEFFFTKYLSVYSFANALGHIFKVLSSFLLYYVFVASAIEKPITILFSEVEDEKNKLKGYLEKMPILIILLDEKGNIILINEKGTDIIGYKKDEIINKNWCDNFIAEDQREEFKTNFKNIINRELEINEEYEGYILIKNGTKKLMKFRNTLLTNETGEAKGIIIVGEDITDKKLYEERLKELASKDPLTKTLNKSAGLDILSSLLDESIKNNMPLTICFIDLDNLKQINDTLGHEKGDEYIFEVVNAIQSTLRQNDYIIRFGGDEFIIIFYNCPKEKAIKAMERAEEKIKEINNTKRLQYSLGVSYGFAENKPGETSNVSTLIRIADQNMYKMKEEHHRDRIN